MIPTDPIGLAIYLISFSIDALSIPEVLTRAASGISATAEKENRDTTPEEDALIDQLVAASKKARDGQ